MSLSTIAEDRIIFQYRNSPKFRQWIDILPSIAATEIIPALEAIENILDIDGQQGELLDIVGRIVGQPRPYVDAQILGFFGWAGNIERDQWGAPWLPRSFAEGVILMPDQYYRILIKAKVAKNTSDATIDDIARAIEIITDANVASLDDAQNMTFSVIFDSVLNIAPRIMLQEFDIVPRPQGVKFTGFTEPTIDGYFGYIGDPNARNYGVAPYAGVL